MKTEIYDFNMLKSQIVDAIHPQKIYLFGSYADGTENQHSDIDLLIIHDTDVPAHKRGQMIRKLFRGMQMPLDVVMYTPEEEKKWEQASLSFLSIIKKHGTLIYEQS